MDNFNDIWILDTLNWKRIRKLLSIGLFASVITASGDVILAMGR